jgi:hypothetical protein
VPAGVKFIRIFSDVFVFSSHVTIVATRHDAYEAAVVAVDAGLGNFFFFSLIYTL